MKATIQIKEEDRKIRHEIVHSFECKICKDVPTDPILMMCCIDDVLQTDTWMSGLFADLFKKQRCMSPLPSACSGIG